MAYAVTGFLEHYIAAWNSHDVPKILTFFTPDSTYEDTALGVMVRGTVELGQFLDRAFFAYPDVSFEVVNSSEAQTFLCWEWIMRGHYVNTGHSGVPAKGQAIHIRGASFTARKGGLVVLNRDYWNVAALSQQLTK